MTATATTTSAAIGWRRMFPAVVSTAVGFALTLTCYNHLLRGRFHTPVERLGALAGVLLCFIAVSYVALRVVQPRLRLFAARVCLTWLGWTIIVAAVLLKLLPTTVPLPPTQHHLELTTTEERHPQTIGGEVWVKSITVGERTPLRADHLAQVGAWEPRADTLLVYQPQVSDQPQPPATLSWDYAGGDDVQLRLGAFPWAGTVQVRWDSQVWSVNLYANPPTERVLTLPGSMIALDANVLTPYQSLCVLADWLSLAAVLFWVSVLVATTRVGRGYTALCARAGLRWWPLPLVFLLALPLAWLLTPFMLSDGVFHHLTTRGDRVWVWGYSVLALGVAGAMLPRRAVSGRATLALPARLRWLTRPLLGQAAAAWLLAVLVAGAAGLFVARQPTVTGQRVVWFKLALDSASGTAPNALLRYKDGASEPVLWQPLAQTNVAIRPLGATAPPVLVQSVATEQGPLPLDQVASSQGLTTTAGITVSEPAGALLSWPAPSHAITLTLTGSGEAEVRWFDQRQVVSLGAQATQVPLRLAAQFQGWVLLPAKELRGVVLELPASNASYRIRQIDILSDTPQRWPGAGEESLWTAAGCRADAENSTLLVTMTSPFCTLQIPLMQAINTPHLGRMALVWLGTTLLVIALLALLALLAGRVQRQQRVGSPASDAADVPVKRARLLVSMAVVGVLALTWHSIFALVITFFMTPDSWGYYGPGYLLGMVNLRLAFLDTARPPGFPLLVAAMIRVFGNTARGVIIGNHMVLALLGPLTVWALARRTGLVIATFAGLSAAILPANSIYANNFMSDVFFAACVTATLLVYIARGNTLRGLLVCGLLVGVATMVRSNGLLLLLTLFGWLLVCGWCAVGSSVRQWFAVRGCAVLLAGYLVTAGPFHLHLWLVRDTTDISQTLSGLSSWFGHAYQGLINADLDVTRPEWALWSVASRDDPYSLVHRAPQMLPRYTGDTALYHTATFREVTHVHQAEWLDNMRVGLLYNLTLIWRPGTATYYNWAQVEAVVSYFQDTVDPPLTPEENENGLLRTLYARSALLVPLKPRLLVFCLFVLKHWVWVVVPALICLALTLCLPRLRRFVPVGIFWLGSAFSAAAIGLPMDRYVIIIEPLLYIVLTATLGTLVQMGYRQVLARTQRGYVAVGQPMAQK